jgi:uncharacterized protein (DUF2267 family)
MNIGKVRAWHRGMKLKELVIEVRNRAHFKSQREVIMAIQATLQTLGERLSGLEATELAGRLPGEVARYVLLNMEMPATPPSTAGFFKRIALREGVDLSMAVPHTRAVMETLQRVCGQPNGRPAGHLPVDDITRLFDTSVLRARWADRGDAGHHAPAL